MDRSSSAQSSATVFAIAVGQRKAVAQGVRELHGQAVVDYRSGGGDRRR
jgi:predicted S18 family serine protease